MNRNLESTRLVHLCVAVVTARILVHIYEMTFLISQGPAFFLNDGRSVLSLNNALMWAKVNAFSLVGNGVRLEPF